MNAVGGVWFPQDCHLDSLEFLAAIRRGISDNGGDFIDGEVEDFETSKGSCKAVILTNGERIAADHVTIACGAWSPAMTRRLGLRLLMQGGKGYSFTIPKPAELPLLCSILKEGRVAITPMGETLRVAGTLEICGNDLSIDRVRLGGIIDAFCRAFPAFSKADFEGLEPWSGLRPCTPDGLPYIGRAPGFGNVVIATGHAMLGLSLGPVTGKLVAALVAGGSIDRKLDPKRFT
jgi:D-amino-acid dehydrogenase